MPLFLETIKAPGLLETWSLSGWSPKGLAEKDHYEQWQEHADSSIYSQFLGHNVKAHLPRQGDTIKSRTIHGQVEAGCSLPSIDEEWINWGERGFTLCQSFDVCSACHKSWFFCKLSQKSAVVLKARAKRSAISGVTAPLPLRIFDKVLSWNTENRCKLPNCYSLKASNSLLL